MNIFDTENSRVTESVTSMCTSVNDIDNPLRSSTIFQNIQISEPKLTPQAISECILRDLNELGKVLYELWS
jgi:hypothetical protein